MKIGTHNASFQADDVLAVAILQRCFYGRLEVVRTRDEALLSQCEFVVDVGGSYDPLLHRYDHHMKDRAGARSNGVLYSACGLVWKHWGDRCIHETERESLSGVLQSRVARLVDEQFIQPVDALDNGQSLHEGGAQFHTAEGDPVVANSFSGLISSLNPQRGERTTFDEAFAGAVRIASTFLDRAIRYAIELDRAEAQVRRAVLDARDPRVVVFEDGGMPWQRTLLRMSQDENAVLSQAEKTLYVVFQDEVGTWMVQCVPDKIGGFGKRKALPEAWAGLRDQEFATLVGTGDAVFCHPGRFICGARTYESAMYLARLAADA